MVIRNGLNLIVFSFKFWIILCKGEKEGTNRKGS